MPENNSYTDEGFGASLVENDKALKEIAEKFEAVKDDLTREDLIETVRQIQKIAKLHLEAATALYAGLKDMRAVARLLRDRS